MYFNKPDNKIKGLLGAISQLKEHNKHVILPDIHLKPKMEAPSSTAISTGDYIIPSLASSAINDGMSIIKLPFKKKELKWGDKIDIINGPFESHKSSLCFH